MESSLWPADNRKKKIQSHFIQVFFPCLKWTTATLQSDLGQKDSGDTKSPHGQHFKQDFCLFISWKKNWPEIWIYAVSDMAGLSKTQIEQDWCKEIWEVVCDWTLKMCSWIRICVSYSNAPKGQPLQSMLFFALFSACS